MKGLSMRYTLVFAALLAAVPAMAAAPFDGKWNGGGAPVGECGAATADITVTDGLISGRISATYQGRQVSGDIASVKVGADGTASVVVGTRQFPMSIRFAGDRFDANLNAFCGLRPLTGTRVK